MYALIENDAVVQYPYGLGQLQQAYPDVSFPRNDDEAYKPFGMYRVFTSHLPLYSDQTERLQEGTPEFNPEVQRWLQSWQVVPLTVEELQAKDKALYDGIVSATQVRLDTFAQSRGYDSILSACTYASSSVPKFTAEGQYCVDARDATWAKLLELLAEVQAGTRPRPSGYADVEPELPPLVWPN